MEVFAWHRRHSILCSLNSKCVSERQVSKRVVVFFSVPSLHKIAIHLFGKNETLIADFYSCIGSNVAIQPFSKNPEKQSSVSPAAIISV